MAESAAQLFSRLGAKELLGDLDLPLFSQLTPEAHGLTPGDVVEFCGAEGTGKSEILLNIAVHCALPKTWQGRKLGGREVDVVYISTDYKFDLLRLTTILEGRVNEKLYSELRDQTGAQVERLESQYKELVLSSLGRVHVTYCCSLSELTVTLQSFKTFLHNHPKVCVLILDNVAAHYWTDRGKTAALPGAEGSQHQWIIALNELIQEYHLVVFAAKPLLLSKTAVVSTGKGEKDGKAFGNVLTVRSGGVNDFMPRLWQRTVKYRFLLERSSKCKDNLVTSTFIAHQVNPLGPSYKYKVCEHGVDFVS